MAFTDKKLMSATGADDSPDAFSFNEVNNATPGTGILSNTVTITGITSAFVTGSAFMEFSINGGAFTNQESLITNNQTLQLRQTVTPASSYFGFSRYFYFL